MTAAEPIAPAVEPPGTARWGLGSAQPVGPTFVAPLETPVGTFYLAWNAQGLVALDAAPSLEAARQQMTGPDGDPVQLRPAVPATLAQPLLARLHGAAEGSDLPLDLRRASPFQRAVWAATATIPRGEVRPYAWVAAQIGRPRAVRAVGSALAANPLPLVIPCHRVVRSDGSLGEYGLVGPTLKRRLLEWEGLDVRTQEELARRGIRWLADPRTRRVCYPSCRRVREQPRERLVPLSRPGEATTAGYRPCTDCRPVL